MDPLLQYLLISPFVYFTFITVATWFLGEDQNVKILFINAFMAAIPILNIVCVILTLFDLITRVDFTIKGRKITK